MPAPPGWQGASRIPGGAPRAAPGGTRRRPRASPSQCSRRLTCRGAQGLVTAAGAAPRRPRQASACAAARGTGSQFQNLLPRVLAPCFLQTFEKFAQGAKGKLRRSEQSLVWRLLLWRLLLLRRRRRWRVASSCAGRSRAGRSNLSPAKPGAWAATQQDVAGAGPPAPPGEAAPRAPSAFTPSMAAPPPPRRRRRVALSQPRGQARLQLECPCW